MNNTTNLTGIEQGRAKKAYDFAQEGNKLKNYDSYVKKVPMMIKVNGLGATFAFIKSKDEIAYKKIYEQTSEWLQEKGLVQKNVDLIDDIISKNSTNYRLITNEVLALFSWLKRFVRDSDEVSKESEKKKN